MNKELELALQEKIESYIKNVEEFKNSSKQSIEDESFDVFKDLYDVTSKYVLTDDDYSEELINSEQIKSSLKDNFGVEPDELTLVDDDKKEEIYDAFENGETDFKKFVEDVNGDLIYGYNDVYHVYTKAEIKSLRIDFIDQLIDVIMNQIDDGEKENILSKDVQHKLKQEINDLRGNL